MTLPNDEPVIPELAFPDGLRVEIGPACVLAGVVDWSDDGVLRGGRFTPDTTMRKLYYPAVPVRMPGLGGITWHHPRWLRAAVQKHHLGLGGEKVDTQD